MKNISIHNIKILRNIIILFFAFGIDIFAQLEPLSTQYMNSQLLINPGYTGTRNSFSVNMATRQQWLGLKGAPANYILGINSPLNKSMASVGGAINVYTAGPVQNSYLDLYYAYLVRLSHNMFISFGISGQLNFYSFSNGDIQLVDENDPNFMFDVSNNFNPNVGAGLFLYTQKFYFGFSVPHILDTRYKTTEDNRTISQPERHYYITSGYGIEIGKNIYLKPSFLARFIESGLYSLDVNAQVFFSKLFWLGASYRIKNTVAFLAGINVSKTLGITYSYDLSVQDEPYINNGSHELSLVFDTSRWLKRNKNRRFLRKKVKKDEDEESIRSIRYF